MEQFLQVQQQVMSSYFSTCWGKADSPGRSLPFFNEIGEIVPGVKATARHHFSSDREILFHHHALGRGISVDQPALVGLPFVPLTVTMEILAEAGALLEPGKVLVAMRDIRATRWITVEDTGFTLEATAAQRAPGAVHVALREAGNAATLRPILAEALVLFASHYPDAGPPRPFVLEHEHVSTWTPERLYSQGMFHGPMLQGVKSIGRSGSNGASATVEVLPHHELLAGDPQPAFLMDPILLDAAGQVPAFWSQEEVERGIDLFPYRVAALHCFVPPPPAGVRLECRVFNKLTTEQQIHSDLEILDAAGKVYYRLETWEHRRFRPPVNFLHLRISPRDAWLSKPWKEPIAAVLEQQQLACCRIDDLTPEFLEASHGIWLKALAYLVLGEEERELWRGLQQAVPKRRQEWLLGRCVAKDAVRLLLRKKFGAELCPADIAIISDEFGRPRVQGAWRARLGVQPVVSISHTGGVAVALAALGPDQMVGIDIESFGRRPEDYERVAFRDDEQRWLASLATGQREEWSLRLWCAKEAVAKALGKGLSKGLHTIHITNAETDTGLVQLELAGGLLDDYREFQGKSMIAYTRRDSDLISSTIVYPQGARG
jgi:phosphopantetheinyl transferase